MITIRLQAVSCLPGVGIFGVELFQMADGGIMLNEVAPRPHNSGKPSTPTPPRAPSHPTPLCTRWLSFCKHPPLRAPPLPTPSLCAHVGLPFASTLQSVPPPLTSPLCTRWLPFCKHPPLRAPSPPHPSVRTLAFLLQAPSTPCPHPSVHTLAILLQAPSSLQRWQTGGGGGGGFYGL